MGIVRPDVPAIVTVGVQIVDLDHADFVIAGVAPGVYALRLSGPEADIRIEDVPVDAR